MRYYFAGAYERRAELEQYADEIVGAGIGAHVVSAWISDPQEGHDVGFSAEGLTDPRMVELAWSYGRRDLRDLMRADAIVSFTGKGTRGGRHVEHGVAIGIHLDRSFVGEDFRLVVVGPREHVFHCHPATEVYADWAAFLTHERETSK
jgi:hypothetical protein